MTTRHVRAGAVCACVLGAALGCAGHGRGTVAAVAEARPSEASPALASALAEYERRGFMTVTEPDPIVGRIAFVAGPTADSTRTIIALSLAASRIDAVPIDVTRDGRPVRRLDAPRLLTAPDESVVMDQIVLTPGTYDLAIAGRTWPLVVPRIPPSGLSSLIPVYDASPRPGPDSALTITARPRASATIGRDTTIAVYVEAYATAGAPARPLAVTVDADSAGPLWHDSIALARHGDLLSGTIDVPVARIGIGALTLTVARGSDRTSTPLFVGFGPAVPAVSFAQLVDVLRYFATDARLDALRRTPAAQRPAAWTEFLGRSGHRGESGIDLLRAYLVRFQDANERWSDDRMPGWESERGRVYLLLGEPEQVFMQDREVEIWVYTRYFTRLVFTDDGGKGRRRLTARSRDDLATLLARLRPRR